MANFESQILGVRISDFESLILGVWKSCEYRTTGISKLKFVFIDYTNPNTNPTTQRLTWT